ncbi:YARHG domain-containing protein [Paraclostridium bifermentans]|uniref:YARHG domain-containing protein n=1 Tax=Paraclostridium bifermentans TaxID=1490 RepID=UPI002149C82F|nr:YARHG domain-containing protein [Paraclostridium bifermentans]MCR1876271.1 YARHG domain-containing protein [Paraclostridium bifermentans]
MKEDIVKSIILSIGVAISKKSKDVEGKLNESLKLKLDNVNGDKTKYINVLKFNVLHYKAIIRNTELFFAKWIDEGYIPKKESLDKELEKIISSCKSYISMGMKKGIEFLNENEINTLKEYEKLDENELVRTLENEYITLSIYRDVLNIFLHKVISTKDISINHLPENSKDAIKEVRKYASMAVQKIKGSMKQKTRSLSPLESHYLKSLKNLNYDELYRKMDKEYRFLCNKENVKYINGYGFGEESINEYISSIILKEIIDEKFKKLLDGAIRFVINGEFGAVNFSDFINYLIIKKLNINEEVLRSFNQYIEDNFKELRDNDLVKKQIKQSDYIDIEEYIYIIENSDMDKQAELKEDLNITKRVQQYRNDNKRSKILKKLVFGGAIISILLFVVIIVSQKDDVMNSQAEVGSIYDKEDSNKEFSSEFKNTYFKNDNYIIEDSDRRYLSENELSSFSKSELALIRNEIFARHGYMFNDEPYKTYFNSKSWYHPNPDIKGDTQEFNDIENENINLIKKLEKNIIENKQTKQNEVKDEDKYKEKEDSIKSSTEIVSYDYADENYLDSYYVVYSTANEKESNAKAQVNKLKGKGIDATIIQEDGYFKVKVGSGESYEVARQISDELKSLSIDSYILAYDRYLEEDIINLQHIGDSGNIEEFQAQYDSLINQIGSTLGYERYVKQINDIYKSVTQSN